MLFTTPQFLFVFLPSCLCIVGLTVAFLGQSAGLISLVLLSTVFYAQWRLSDVFVILFSILFNYTIARNIPRLKCKARFYLLFAGVSANILCLIYYKYTDFVLVNIGKNPISIVLPLAISFYTFQQIAFIVDVYRGKVTNIPFTNYVVTVLFFPHLIAGPLIHYKEIMDQFDRKFTVSIATVMSGIPVFAMGLAKKIAIADPIASIINPLFVTAKTAPLEFFSAWTASLGYTAQLYYDFSGYSDMAIGLGMMFGISLPLNFYSPYKSTSIIEFWRRWHITLSSFLRDYVYIPLGGNRVSRPHWYANLLSVMLIGGMWHGAGWNFLLWGGLHGSYLAINHMWQGVSKGFGSLLDVVLRPVYALITFGAVVFAWIFFRSNSIDTAENIISGMVGAHHASLPGEITYWFPHQPGISLGVAYTGMGMTFANSCFVAVSLLIAYGAVFFAPNTAQIFRLVGSDRVSNPSSPTPSSPSMGWTLVCASFVGVALWLSAFGILGAVPSEFLYFQF